MKRQDAYMCSKPLQYMNICNIGPVDDASPVRVLGVVNAFSGAEAYVEGIRKYDKRWDEVILFPSVAQKNLWLLKRKTNNLFVENDASWKMFFLCVLRRVRNLYCFEEGIGSYKSGEQHDGFSKKSRLEKFIIRRIGVGTHFGDSRFCMGIFLTKPLMYNNKFQSTKGQAFQLPFVDYLIQHEDILKKISGGMPDVLDVHGKKILIYITEWVIYDEIVQRLQEEAPMYDCCFIKPHPHIRNSIQIGDGQFTILANNLMMELILSYLIKRNNDITVWHCSSTSVVHFMNKIKSVNFTSVSIFNEYVSWME